ncbi:MAG: efflux RND transporter periplasmic adaptor subunit [Planctomycetes bacterium]|nr:efflux RND transporter periplasmic adaptor subunit [Planctomycetota bacterium]
MPAANDLAALKIDRAGKRRRLPLWPFLFVAALAAVVVAYPAIQKNMEGVEVATAPAISVLALKQLAASTPREADLTAAGYIVADRQAVLAATFVGRLSKLNVKEAEDVKKDQIVAEVEHFAIDAQIAELEADSAEQKAEIERLRKSHAQALAEVDSAKSALATFDAETDEMKIMWADAKRRLERDRKLAEANALGFSEADDRETEVKMAEAKLETIKRRRTESEQTIEVRVRQAEVAQSAIAVAEAHLATTEARLGVLESQRIEYFIHAPFDGVVTEKAAEQGEIIAPVSVGGQMARGSIVTVADWDSLQAEVDVAETYIARVRPGQRAAITVDAMPGKVFAGKAQRILPRADRAKATLQVRVEFLKDKDGKSVFAGERILPDMGIRVKFLPDDAPAGAETGAVKPKTCVPKEALQGDGAAACVWIVKDKKALKRAVTPGERAGDWVEIAKGIEPGDQVVVKGAEKLSQDGEKVKVPER